jgi:phage shock protein C
MERLYRPKNNRVIAGVCGGFAQYFRIDPTIIRIIWILISLSGTGILAYIVAAIIMPDEDKVVGSRNEWNESPKTEADDFVSSFESEKDNWGEQPPKYNSERNRFVLGAILVGLGILFLGNQIIPRLFELKYLVPILLIGIGGFIVFRGRH